MHIKKGDKVTVMTGKDAGKTGEVVKAFPKDNSVIISGINKFKKHRKPTKAHQKGQLIEKEMPVHASNVKKIKE